MSGDCFHAIEERFMVQSFGEEYLQHRRAAVGVRG
jgi:hypothetical protein